MKYLYKQPGYYLGYILLPLLVLVSLPFCNSFNEVKYGIKLLIADHKKYYDKK